MGIDGLGTFLRKKTPQAFLQVQAMSFCGSRMAFDMHQWVYQAFYRNGGNASRALRDVTLFVKSLQAMRVTATFVFDGVTTGLKPRAHSTRAADSASKVQTVQALHAAVHSEHTEYESLADYFVACEMVDKKRAQASKPPSSLFADTKKALAEFGSVIIADDDAERLVASMAASGLVDHAVSRDYDTLIFGAPRVVLDFPHVVRRALVTPDEDTDVEGTDDLVTVLDLALVLRGLELNTLAELQDMAILAGCDYTIKIPGIGPGIAHRLIRTHKTIETVLAVGGLRQRIPDEFQPWFARARFQGLDPDKAKVRTADSTTTSAERDDPREDPPTAERADPTDSTAECAASTDSTAECAASTAECADGRMPHI
jgi:5'-3' exonuclease